MKENGSYQLKKINQEIEDSEQLVDPYSSIEIRREEYQKKKKAFEKKIKEIENKKDGATPGELTDEYDESEDNEEESRDED